MRELPFVSRGDNWPRCNDYIKTELEVVTYSNKAKSIDSVSTEMEEWPTVGAEKGESIEHHWPQQLALGLLAEKSRKTEFCLVSLRPLKTSNLHWQPVSFWSFERRLKQINFKIVAVLHIYLCLNSSAYQELEDNQDLHALSSNLLAPGSLYWLQNNK